MIKLIYSAVLSLFPAYVWAINVTMVLPKYEEHQFWYLVADAAKSAAQGSEVNLHIVHIDNNRFAFKDAITTALSSNDKPDYIVFRPFQGVTHKMFDLLEQSKINFVTLEHVTTGKEDEQIGRPLQNYQHWLGEVYYDQTHAGELLTNQLIKTHQFQFPDKPTYITGLGGSYDAVTEMRNDGLKLSISKNKNSYLNQIFTMNFDPTLVKQRFNNIIQRYPNTDIFWCASAQMAVEVVQQINKEKLHAKQVHFIGGFDFIPDALEMVKNEQITALVGGHFLMGAKAITQIIDHHHGISDFNQTNNFELVTKTNVEDYQQFFAHKRWRAADFSQFLLSNKAISAPQEVNIQNLINQLNHKQAQISMSIY